MEDIKDIVAQNLTNLRKANKITQLELAEKLNYSDKAISKWERGESLPDVITLKQLADMYGVNVDYILNEQTEDTIAKYRIPFPELNNKLIITILACLSILTLVAILYINFLIIFDQHIWVIWIWSLPAISVVLIILSFDFIQYLVFILTWYSNPNNSNSLRWLKIKKTQNTAYLIIDETKPQFEFPYSH